MRAVCTGVPSTGGEFELEDDCARYYESHLHASEKYLDRQSRLGTIDPKSNLRDQPVYLFSGKLDIAVVQAEMDDLNAEYQHYGAKTAYDNAFVATHGWESPDGENSCIQGGLPFTIRCFKDGSLYDSEQTWLTMFLGKLKPRNTGSLTGSLINFDQTKFGASYSNSMDTNGYVYVPHSCAAGKRCSLVVILHGCTMTQANKGTNSSPKATWCAGPTPIGSSRSIHSSCPIHRSTRLPAGTSGAMVEQTTRCAAGLKRRSSTRWSGASPAASEWEKLAAPHWK